MNLAFLSASMVCANGLKLFEEIKNMEELGIDYLHCDIFDGNYVNNISMGFYIIEQIVNVTTIPVEIHLGIREPERYFKVLKDIGVSMISIQADSTPHSFRAIERLKKMGIKAGIVLNPSQGTEEIRFLIDKLDYVVIMTVNLGFAGQKFIPEVLPKIRETKEIIKNKNRDVLIQVDGNINKDTIPVCFEEGADIFVLGTSSLFKEGIDRKKEVEEIRSLFL